MQSAVHTKRETAESDGGPRPNNAWLREHAADEPATSFKNRPFTPVLQTSFASPRLPTMNDRPQTSLASGGASVFPKLSYDKRMPHYSRAQIEMCGRRRYTSRLTNSGGLGLTRITGY